MSKNDDATTNGVREAFDHWLWNHDITTRDVMEEAINTAFAQWLSRNEETVTEAIAKQVVEGQGHRWVSIAEASQGQPDAPRGATRDACPVCKQAATYARELDRYIHADGTDNRACWVTLARGTVAAPKRPADDEVLADISRLRLRLRGEQVVRATTNLLNAVARYAPDDTALAGILRYLLACVHDSSAGDGELWLTDDQPALHGLALWAQRDPDGFVLLLPVDA